MKVLGCLILPCLVLSACGGAGTKTVPPPSPSESAPTPQPIEPSRTASLSPNDFPPLSTATSVADSGSSQPGSYFNPEFGVALRYPPDWRKVDIGDAEHGELLWLASPGDGVQVILFYTLWADKGLEGAAHAIGDSSLGGMKNLQLLSDHAMTLESDAEAWQTIVTAEYDNGAPLKESLTTILGGGRTFSLLSYGDPAEFDQNQPELDSIANSLHFTGELLYGLPRAQSLVLAGYESTNPREYDPATQPSGGDGLVFSGLVAFTPQLNLVPELAESWTVTEDGVVYTFKLRMARFHNGRPVTGTDDLQNSVMATSTLVTPPGRRPTGKKNPSAKTPISNNEISGTPRMNST